MEVKTFTFTDKAKKLAPTEKESTFFGSLSNTSTSLKIAVIDITTDNINNIVIKTSTFNGRGYPVSTLIYLYKYWGRILWQGNRYIISYDALIDELKKDLIIESTIGMEIEIISDKDFSMTMVYELFHR